MNEPIMTNEVNTNLDEKIRNIANKEGFITYEVEKKGSSNGGGYMGNIILFDVKGKTKHGDKEINIFVKQILYPKIKMIYDVPMIYKREKFVYTDLLKKMFDLQEKANIPHSDRFQFAKVFDESDNENIILENLVAKGFRIYGSLDIISLEYAELAIKGLARLHGLSLAMQIKTTDYFETIVKNMDCVYKFDEYFCGFQHNIRNTAIQFLPDNLREKLTLQLVNIVDKYQTYMNDTSCPVKTICHGDFRPSNVMMKEIDGKPTQVIPVDYQITFYGNPVLDFIYFIFWGTDQQFRRRHLEHLKQLYHRHLTTFLNYFTINVEEVFPKAEFERQLQEKLDFGLAISMFYLPILFTKEEDVPDFEESAKPLNEMQLKVDDKFGERFRGIVDDFIAWGYL